MAEVLLREYAQRFGVRPPSPRLSLPCEDSETSNCCPVKESCSIDVVEDLRDREPRRRRALRSLEEALELPEGALPLALAGQSSSGPETSQASAKVGDLQSREAALEEETARVDGERSLKKALRAEFDIGWSTRSIPSNIPRARAMVGSDASEGTYCIAMAGSTDSTFSFAVQPTVEPSAAVLLEYLSVALRVRLTEGTEPFFSLDPLASAEGEVDFAMQVKRYQPQWLAGTSAGEVMFQADYYMKELSMGEAAQPIACMRSCLDLMQESDDIPDEWTARAWFTIRKAEVYLSDDNVLIPSVRMGVEAREIVQHESGSGWEDVPLTRPTHPLVRYAEAFTESFDLIAERKSSIYHLRELAKACVLAKHIIEVDAPIDATWLKSLYTGPSVCCMEVPQLWNEIYCRADRPMGTDLSSLEREPRRKRGVYGGVQLAMDRFAVAPPRAMTGPTAQVKPPPALALAAIDAFGRAVEDPLAPRPTRRVAPPPLLRTAGAPLSVVSSFAQESRMRAPTLPAPAALTSRPGATLTRIQGVEAVAPPVTGRPAQMPAGVDLNLSNQNVSRAARLDFNTSNGTASECQGLTGIASQFWSHIDTDDSRSLFTDGNLELLRKVFDPRLCDRRMEGDRFVPPATRLACVERLRRQVSVEQDQRELRKDTFLRAGMKGVHWRDALPASWHPVVLAVSPCWREDEAETCETPPGRPHVVLSAMPDCELVQPTLMPILSRSAPVFSQTTEDGTTFRIYSQGGFEIRTTQEAEGRETVGAMVGLAETTGCV
mmetsp:Transcript_22503/g.52333  ORF Transcript_22503/g.52333 Transcript_22503/m.52333 type:complete len:775 (-) Transcript_22503:55-2379(-)